MENFSNIIFDKNVFEKTSQYLKSFSKVFILTSPIPRDQYLQRFVNILNENKITFWAYSLPHKSKCDNDAVLKTCAKIKGAEVIIALGAGTVCDVAKISAQKLNIPYCTIPTTITHYGIFNNVALLNNNGLIEEIQTANPSKVFIDENIIKKSPEQFIISALCFCMGLLEQEFVLFSKKIILNECDFDFKTFSEKIKKIEELINWLSLSKDFALLNLMDYVLDMNKLFDKNYISNTVKFASMLNCSTLKNNFGEKCFLCSSVLLKVYNSFFNQKIITIKNIPEMEKIIKIYGKISKNNVFFENYIKKTQIYLNNNFLNKIQNCNYTIIPTLINHQITFSRFAKKLSLLQSQSTTLRMIDENELYSTLEILPFVQSNFLLDILTRYGYMNVI